jgi:hypothetical protein
MGSLETEAMQNSDRVSGPAFLGRFLGEKKAAQKLLLLWAMGVVGDNAHGPE